jgi:hypothetical protein
MLFVLRLRFEQVDAGKLVEGWKRRFGEAPWDPEQKVASCLSTVPHVCRTGIIPVQIM